ncbi:galactosyl transferase GMA12/MNN10 family-domain-containing protein [Zychaea mexicana]|uniref:galactosyl transferase GMA12/MNN10 family-domain-containing protein n=1 Tax=Zychaea mexicana TaxID=64656 RepID=UPI0022FDC80E|nr:galactosyl transferase GMA12/MNN10 family-domain-containing protein [Zychaea mexicana]KAI9498671.1 galactosyl transferase GMA12/MNN10 family-domain-containing protein [Zychaea mexicana]
MLPGHTPSHHRRRHFRVRRLLTIFIVVAFFSLFYYNVKLRSEIAIDNARSTTTSTAGGAENLSNHYPYLVVIASTATEFTRRGLIRQMYFGLDDNIEPCMRYNADTMYRFWVHGERIPRKTAERRQYEAEKMEWNDIEEIPEDVKFEQSSILEWADKILVGERGITYDYLIVQDVNSFVQLPSVKQELSNTKTDNVVWGSFAGQETDKYVFAIGSTAAKRALNLWHTTYDREGQNLLTEMYLHFQHQSNDGTGPLFLRKDGTLHHFINAVDANVELTEEKVATVIAVTHVHQDELFINMAQWTALEPSAVCRSDKRPRIALMTSSYIYPDNCMEPSATLSAINKRKYAEKHNHSFVPRSIEFAQQRGRKTVWGKVDAVQNVLPHYDWIFWTDMDCVIMNSEQSLNDLLDKLRNEYPEGKDAFDKNVDFIASRPPRDPMLNAGVFFLRNTEWSMQFLNEVQDFKEWYNKRPSYEQGAMADVANKYKSHVYLLYPDVHTFNTFPKFYSPGDFIVHYAPDGCPNQYVLQGLEAAERIEHGGVVNSLCDGKSCQ